MTPDQRDIRAAREPMVVIKEAPGMFRVYSGRESIYTVDLAGPACTCRDFQFRHFENDKRCKHIRRVEQTLGHREVPSGVDPDPVLEHQLRSETLP
jgi:hypothetical protein